MTNGAAALYVSAAMKYNKNTTVRLKLRDIRLSMGLNQLEFAMKVKLYPCELSDYERGKRLPGLAKLASIALSLKLKLDDLVIIKNRVSA